MKTVLSIETLEAVDIIDSAIECSVCGLFKPKIDYCSGVDGKLAQSRTNCEKCYNLSREDYQNTKKSTGIIKNSAKYKLAIREFSYLSEMYHSSISTDHLIKELKKLPKNSRVIIKQEGYYCDSEFGEIYDEPLQSDEDKNIYFIGYGGYSAYY